jgi:hypothetical protein
MTCLYIYYITTDADLHMEYILESVFGDYPKIYIKNAGFKTGDLWTEIQIDCQYIWQNRILKLVCLHQWVVSQDRFYCIWFVRDCRIYSRTSRVELAWHCIAWSKYSSQTGLYYEYCFNNCFTVNEKKVKVHVHVVLCCSHYLLC